MGTVISFTIQPGDVLFVKTGHDDWNRGELILFQGRDGEELFIKRIVGLPAGIGRSDPGTAYGQRETLAGKTAGPRRRSRFSAATGSAGNIVCAGGQSG